MLEVLMMPAFKRNYKKLHPNQKSDVCKAIETIAENPTCGTEKKGDLADVFVYKFDCVGQQMLLAYEFDPVKCVLLPLVAHENFYRNLKR